MRLSWPTTGWTFRISRVSAAASRTLSTALAEDARLSGTFLALTLGSSAIATFGLLENSAAVIIGAMIIAPLLSPIQALAYGILDGSVKNIRASVISLGIGSALERVRTCSTLASRSRPVWSAGSPERGRASRTWLPERRSRSR
jgi:hypothetical protein